MIRNTSVLLFISILLIMIDLIQLSSEYEKDSTESELHNDNSFDRTIFDREDRKQESASKSLEEDIIGQIRSVDNDNASETEEILISLFYKPAFVYKIINLRQVLISF